MAATYATLWSAFWARLYQPAPPPAFEVSCSCGSRVSGVRTSTCQTVRCAACGQEVFVLPASSLPLPEPPVSSETAATPAARRPLVDTDQLRRVLAWYSKAAVLAVRRWATLPRVLTLSVALLVLGTLTWTWQSSRERSFAASLPEGLRAGREAFDQGDLVSACRHLAEADRAARGLDRGTAQERTARQLYQEALHWSSLSHAGLDELFATWDQAVADHREDTFADDFARKFGRRAFVIDGWVDVERDQPPFLDFVRLSDSRVGRISLAGAPWLASLPVGLNRVVFLGEPLTITHAPNDPERAILTFRGETCVLATHGPALQRQGWPIDDELERVLATQRQWLGVESPASDRMGDARAVPMPGKGNLRGIAAGDLEGDVLAKLRKPDRMARIGLFNRIDEQWIYEGPSRLYVNLARPTTGEQAKVTAVETGPKS